jgi:hypothetical protein
MDQSDRLTKVQDCNNRCNRRVKLKFAVGLSRLTQTILDRKRSLVTQAPSGIRGWTKSHFPCIYVVSNSINCVRATATLVIVVVFLPRAHPVISIYAAVNLLESGGIERHPPVHARTSEVSILFNSWKLVITCYKKQMAPVRLYSGGVLIQTLGRFESVERTCFGLSMKILEYLGDSGSTGRTYDCS